MTIVPFKAQREGSSLNVLPVYTGTRNQRGYGLGSMISGLFSSALPILKKGAVSLGKRVLKTGLEIASDAAKGENLGQSAKRRFTQSGIDTLNQLSNSTVKSRKTKNNIKTSRRSRKRINPRRLKARGSRDIFSS